MNLLTYVQQNKDSARKIFGNKELEIIMKQLQGSDLTQSEKNRLSRDIREKFRFIADCSRFKNEFTLKKNQINKNIIRDSLEILMQEKKAEDYKAILLAGSYADKSFTKKSDIDIVVIFNNPLTMKEATLFRKNLLGKLNSKIDLQVFNVLPDKIKESMIKSFKILYKKDLKAKIF